MKRLGDRKDHPIEQRVLSVAHGRFGVGDHRSAMAVRQLPITWPDKSSAERINQWPYLVDVLLEEIEGEILVLIECPLGSGTDAGGRRSPYTGMGGIRSIWLRSLRGKVGQLRVHRGNWISITTSKNLRNKI